VDHVVGVFTKPAALMRIAGAVLVEQHGEWVAGDRRYLAAGPMLEATMPADPVPEEIAMPR